MAIFSGIAAIVGFVTGVLTTAGLAAPLAAAAANLIVGTAISALSSRLASRPDAPGLTGISTRTAAGKKPEHLAVMNQAIASRVRGYGRDKLGGIRAFFDSRNGDLYQIVIFHHGRIDELESLWLGDQRVEIEDGVVTTDPYNESNGAHVRVATRNGGVNPSAYPRMVGDWPNEIWTEDHRLEGLATAMVIFASPKASKFTKVFPEGHLTPIRAVMRLSRVLIPKTGEIRWTRNSSHCIRDYLVHPDGYGLDEDDIDEDSFHDFAVLCAETVALKGGGEEPRYCLDGVYDLLEDPKNTLQRMMATCDAEIYETSEGKIAIRGGKWEKPTVVIEDKNILSFDIQEGAGVFAEFNELGIIYTAPDQDYEPAEAGRWVNRESQALIGEVVEEMDLDMVHSPSQARRLAKIHEAKRNPRWRGTISTDLVGLNARGERLITVKIDELGINSTFLVESHAIRSDLTGCEIAIAHLPPEAYEWRTSYEVKSPRPPADTRPSLTLPVPTITDVDVELRTIVTGTTAKVLVVTVAPPPRASLNLQAQLRLITPVGPWEGMTETEDGLEAFSGMIKDGETYEVRARWIAPKGTASNWSTSTEVEI